MKNIIRKTAEFKELREEASSALAASPPRRKKERNTKMEITQKEINALATKAGRISELLQEVNKMAFELAKTGNASGVFQLRGAFSGTLAAAQATDGFLSGLVSIIDR